MTLSATEHPMREDIRRLIRARGPMGLSDIAKAVTGKVGQVGYHLGILVKDGDLDSFEQEAATVYGPTTTT